MGIEYYTARFLLDARRRGVSFDSALTIGRQYLIVSASRVQQLGREFGFDATSVLRMTHANRGFVEPFLATALQTKTVQSLDATSYEDATIVHDLNVPVPESLRNQFDVVIEAGTLEHVFNFPNAIASLMSAVRPGGHLLIQSPANNYFGHGFYQFSPELFYRVLCPANGFRIHSMLAFEHVFPDLVPRSRMYEVADPAAATQRVELVNKRPVLLLIDAEKIEDTPIFATTPQQSDYVALWQSGPSERRPSLLASVTRRLRPRLESLPVQLVGSLWLQRLLNRGNPPSLDNPRQFRPRSGT